MITISLSLNPRLAKEYFAQDLKSEIGFPEPDSDSKTTFNQNSHHVHYEPVKKKVTMKNKR